MRLCPVKLPKNVGSIARKIAKWCPLRSAIPLYCENRILAAPVHGGFIESERISVYCVQDAVEESCLNVQSSNAE